MTIEEFMSGGGSYHEGGDITDAFQTYETVKLVSQDGNGTLNLPPGFVIPAAKTLELLSGTLATASGTTVVNGTFINGAAVAFSGSLQNNSSNTVINTGVMELYGGYQGTGDSRLKNEAGGTLFAWADVEVSGVVENDGDIGIYGDLLLTGGSCLMNHGEMVVQGPAVNGSELTGTFINRGDGSISLLDTVITVTDPIINEGMMYLNDVSISARGEFAITNHGDIYMDESGFSVNSSSLNSPFSPDSSGNLYDPMGNPSLPLLYAKTGGEQLSGYCTDLQSAFDFFASPMEITIDSAVTITCLEGLSLNREQTAVTLYVDGRLECGGITNYGSLVLAGSDTGEVYLIPVNDSGYMIDNHGDLTIDGPRVFTGDAGLIDSLGNIQIRDGAVENGSRLPTIRTHGVGNNVIHGGSVDNRAGGPVLSHITDFQAGEGLSGFWEWEHPDNSTARTLAIFNYPGESDAFVSFLSDHVAETVIVGNVESGYSLNLNDETKMAFYGSGGVWRSSDRFRFEGSVHIRNMTFEIVSTIEEMIDYPSVYVGGHLILEDVDIIGEPIPNNVKDILWIADEGHVTIWGDSSITSTRDWVYAVRSEAPFEEVFDVSDGSLQLRATSTDLFARMNAGEAVEIEDGYWEYDGDGLYVLDYNRYIGGRKPLRQPAIPKLATSSDPAFQEEPTKADSSAQDLDAGSDVSGDDSLAGLDEAEGAIKAGGDQQPLLWRPEGDDADSDKEEALAEDEGLIRSGVMKKIIGRSFFLISFLWR